MESEGGLGRGILKFEENGGAGLSGFWVGGTWQGSETLRFCAFPVLASRAPGPNFLGAGSRLLVRVFLDFLFSWQSGEFRGGC